MVFVTAGAFTPRARAFVARVDNLVVEKPFDTEAFRVMVREGGRRSTRGLDKQSRGHGPASTAHRRLAHDAVRARMDWTDFPWY